MGVKPSVMNRSEPPSTSSRFQAQVRHYHRSGSKPESSWEQWIDGTDTRSKQSRRWGRIALAVLGVLVLGGIIAGLVIELGVV